jgi:hypothetical protein
MVHMHSCRDVVKLPSSRDGMHQGLAPGSMRLAQAWHVTKHGREVTPNGEGEKRQLGTDNIHVQELACLTHSYRDHLWEL